MILNRSILTALAWTGAVSAVLVAMLLPLPRAVLSEEELAAGRMPETRLSVERARAAFDRAESAYRSYVAGNDVGAALNAFDEAVSSLDSQTNPTAARGTVQSAAAPLIAYLQQLEAYAGAGEDYFAALGHYDDELMSWTRSLGAESEALRSATWPIVEYLKLYPPPVGLADEYTWVSASDVMSRTEGVRGNSADGAAPPLQAHAAGVREAGRSIEYIESLHPQYETLLGDYDDNLQAVLAARASTEPDVRRTLATVLDIGVAVLLGLGIAGLLLPRGTRRAET
jgi:hypothetical protein